MNVRHMRVVCVCVRCLFSISKCYVVREAEEITRAVDLLLFFFSAKSREKKMVLHVID